jgi:hypothetical protein
MRSSAGWSVAVAFDLLALFRKLRLETREELVMAEAKGAASTAASAATTAVVADLARRIGALQERNCTPRLPTETRAP